MLLTGARSGGGGAYRDRTDDLKLAKLALSQLSYGPVVQPYDRVRHSLSSGGTLFARAYQRAKNGGPRKT